MLDKRSGRLGFLFTLLSIALKPLVTIAGSPAPPPTVVEDSQEEAASKEGPAQSSRDHHSLSPLVVDWERRDQRLRFARGLSLVGLFAGAGLVGAGVVSVIPRCSEGICSRSIMPGLLITGGVLVVAGTSGTVAASIKIKYHHLMRPVRVGLGPGSMLFHF